MLGEFVGTVGFQILRANNCRCEILSVSRQAMESTVAQGIPSARARDSSVIAVHRRVQ